jgi:hypothetical protein
MQVDPGIDTARVSIRERDVERVAADRHKPFDSNTVETRGKRPVMAGARAPGAPACGAQARAGNFAGLSVRPDEAQARTVGGERYSLWNCLVIERCAVSGATNMILRHASLAVSAPFQRRQRPPDSN